MTHNRARAILTRYKGYAFRSRLEARWAVFFDHLKIRWEYEPEGFELGNGLRYLPDFWLPDWKMWVEIKPDAPDDAAAEKAWRLAWLSKFPVFLAHGLPDGGGTLYLTHTQAGGEVGIWPFPAVASWCHLFAPKVWIFDDVQADKWPDEYDQDKTTLIVCEPASARKELPGVLSEIAIEGLNKARAARFEFGEKGAA